MPREARPGKKRKSATTVVQDYQDPEPEPVAVPAQSKPMKPKSAAPPPPSKLVKTPPPLHDSQLALAERAVELAAEHKTGIIFIDNPGFGKTRAVGQYIQDTHGYDLAVWVAKTPKLARDQGDEIGAIYDAPLNSAHVPCLAAKLAKRRDHMVVNLLVDENPIVVTITQSFFKTLLKDQKFVSDFTGPLGSPKIHVILDEVHSFYTKSSAATAAMGWLKKLYPMRITGVTATPQLESGGCMKRAITLFGGEPTTVKYTGEERTKFKADLMAHRPKSTPKWQKVALPAPDPSVYDAWLKDLGTIVLGNTAKATQDVGINAWMARGNIIAMVLANQIHGNAEDGGVLFQKQKADGVPWQRKLKDGNFVDVKRPDVAIIVYKTPAGNKEHLRLLQGLEGTEGVRPFAVHDLRTKDIASYKAALSDFTSDAIGTDKTVLGIVDKSQIEGTNDYAKNVSAIIAVGAWTDAELDQLKGRLGRPCKLVGDNKAGDLVPKAHMLVHFASEWEKKVKEIGLVRHSVRTVAVPESIKKEHMEALKDAAVEEKVQKVIDGEERVFGKKGHELASTFLSSLKDGTAFEEAYKKAIKTWFTMDFEDPDDVDVGDGETN